MPDSHQNALHDVKAEEHHGKDEALVQDGIEERLILEPRSKVKMLTDEQDLCENERVNNREGVLRIIQMALCQDKALVNREQPKDNPKVEKDYDEPFEFIGGSLLQVALTRDWKAFFRHVRTPLLLLLRRVYFHKPSPGISAAAMVITPDPCLEVRARGRGCFA
jgi:hypothetical protein